MSTGSRSQLSEFSFPPLNSHHPSISFTLEVGSLSINYLDTTITLFPSPQSPSLSLSFELYRKHSFTNVLISGSSFHPHVHQRAGILAMIHRLLSTPLSSVNFQHELSIVEYVAHFNNLNLDVKKIVYRKIRLTVPLPLVNALDESAYHFSDHQLTALLTI